MKLLHAAIIRRPEQINLSQEYYVSWPGIERAVACCVSCFSCTYCHGGIGHLLNNIVVN